MEVVCSDGLAHPHAQVQPRELHPARLEHVLDVRVPVPHGIVQRLAAKPVLAVDVRLFLEQECSHLSVALARSKMQGRPRIVVCLIRIHAIRDEPPYLLEVPTARSLAHHHASLLPHELCAARAWDDPPEHLADLVLAVHDGVVDGRVAVLVRLVRSRIARQQELGGLHLPLTGGEMQRRPAHLVGVVGPHLPLERQLQRLNVASGSSRVHDMDLISHPARSEQRYGGVHARVHAPPLVVAERIGIQIASSIAAPRLYRLVIGTSTHTRPRCGARDAPHALAGDAPALPTAPIPLRLCTMDLE
mmetsp:Transcript_2708/g.6665  ORF Transcript_2708/g.6665 Transcript_2708/m.6665 type:complete len:303 (-) Transcript_2708:1527-2435(-)